ncbi:transcriptional regulator, HxlR family [Chryseobacterium vrystaatense]|uniref:Transcriptional regulator, HxlR family n=2 Tax=Chryseobacterium vrystaatense TaxID=307480 RepID=A0A1M5BV26_9FLAO|nr:transcriptional regulator, HxlR family [Chryseobacterium vrystaatense]
MSEIDKKITCDMQSALEVLGGKWTFLIIYTLLDGKKRFKELERAVIGINTRMLVKDLKTLEEHRIVKREAFATIPPTVEYSLTEKGRELEATMRALNNWTIEWFYKKN